jgi:hypothetical protein
MHQSAIVVDGFVTAAADSTINLQDDVWALALDQRAFGPRRLVVHCADRAGRVVGIAHTLRTDPPERALGPCLHHVGAGAATAVAFCDEMLSIGPPPLDLARRFGEACRIARRQGIHLVDWIACDDHLFRSSRFALSPETAPGEWWDIPEEG